MNFVLLGPPGSGKGTQGEYLEEMLSIKRISTGDLLRNEVAANSTLGDNIKDILARGEFVDDEIVLSLLKKVISTPEYAEGFILDGFPRNANQAQMLNNLLEDLKKHIDIVLYFHVSEQVLIDRICNRYYCDNCKANYNKLFKNPKIAGICDECGSSDFKVRADDNVDSVRLRFNEYQKQTMPLISYYTDRGVLYRMDSDKEIKEISKEISILLEKFKLT